ncbi:MAG: ABC transporter permease subunit, partial [Bacteroidia bacterium]|nr:ABC transporter permease subunit [Bacteroidia bacterium]
MDFLERIASSFYNNLISGEAYLVVLKGLLTTVMLSVLGLLFGTVLGGLFCALRLSGRKILEIPVRILTTMLLGSPVTLLLMLLYYVVFANSSTDALFIAILAFTLHTGAHVSEIMRSSIGVLSRREWEAARMLGFTEVAAFRYITLPQAWKIAKPVYQNTVINLVQWTSVVGYVTITDLTRTLNNVGARTGDPFFALFFGILIYLGLSWSVKGL